MKAETHQARARAARAMAFACMLFAAPLILLAIAWLPASVLSIRHYAEARTMPGTSSYHESMDHAFWYAVESTLIRTAALIVYVALAGKLIGKSPVGIGMWMSTLVVALLHLLTFSIEHPIRASEMTHWQEPGFLIFWIAPAAVAILCLVGLSVEPRDMGNGV